MHLLKDCSNLQVFGFSSLAKFRHFCHIFLATPFISKKYLPKSSPSNNIFKLQNPSQRVVLAGTVPVHVWPFPGALIFRLLVVKSAVLGMPSWRHAHIFLSCMCGFVKLMVVESKRKDGVSEPLNTKVKISSMANSKYKASMFWNWKFKIMKL